MIKQTNAKIFLADERGLNQTDWFRSCNTFNFGQYFNQHKTPFGGIYVFNDDIIDGGHSLQMQIEEDSFVILLPVYGAIEYNIMQGQSGLLAAGQLQLLMAEKGTSLTINNPFSDTTVNFIQIWIKADHFPTAVNTSAVTYDVNKFMNCLVQVTPTVVEEVAIPFSVSIGKFSGRGETVHPVRKSNAGFFVFVLQGAFEVEGRLLHARDGLALWGTEEAEMEAFSNDALLLAIETPFTFSEA